MKEIACTYGDVNICCYDDIVAIYCPGFTYILRYSEYTHAFSFLFFFGEQRMFWALMWKYSDLLILMKAAHVLFFSFRSWCAEIIGEMWTCQRLSTSWPFWWTKRKRARYHQFWLMAASVSCGSNTIISTVSLLIPKTHQHLCYARVVLTLCPVVTLLNTRHISGCNIQKKCQRLPGFLFLVQNCSGMI